MFSVRTLLLLFSWGTVEGGSADDGCGSNVVFRPNRKQFHSAWLTWIHSLVLDRFATPQIFSWNEPLTLPSTSQMLHRAALHTRPSVEDSQLVGLEEKASLKPRACSFASVCVISCKLGLIRTFCIDYVWIYKKWSEHIIRITPACQFAYHRPISCPVCTDI